MKVQRRRNGKSASQELSAATIRRKVVFTFLYLLPCDFSSLLRFYAAGRRPTRCSRSCSQNLGNETGSDMVDSDIELLSSSPECGEGPKEEKRKERQVRNFPPPLTMIRGSESVRVRPHREGGRLVLELTKVKVPFCFRAQRSHGRLRLCFWNNRL